MKDYKKQDFPVDEIRRYLEPGPIVLVSSAWKGHRNIMTMGWHMVMGFQPSLIGCYIWDANHSYDMIKKSKECVFNIPTTDIAGTVVKIGNCSGRKMDKFAEFNLTPLPSEEINAPLIKECYANFECRLVETSLIKRYGFFIFEVVKAHVPKTPKYPETIHYRGEGRFMISGPTTSKYRKWFKSGNM